MRIAAFLQLANLACLQSERPCIIICAPSNQRRRVLYKPAPIPPGMDMKLTLELSPDRPGDFVGEVGSAATDCMCQRRAVGLRRLLPVLLAFPPSSPSTCCYTCFQEPNP